MKFHPAHDVMWFFVWSNGSPGPYPCAITAYTRKGLIEQVEKIMGGPWRKICRQGGRAMRCRVSPLTSNGKDASR